MCYHVDMKKIAAAEFKARCLTLMDVVQSTRELVVITKRGKPVAKLVPMDRAKDDFIGSLKGVFRVVGDIESPAVPPEDWETSW
jgi:prevent-host-death family protein